MMNNALVKLSAVVAAFNFLLIFAPELQDIQPLYLFVSVSALNIAIVASIIRKVKASTDDESHQLLASFSTKAVAILGIAFTAIMVLLAFYGDLQKQAMVFAFWGYAYLLAPMKILDLAVKKRIEELRGAGAL